MGRLARTARRHWQRTRGVERFVRLIVGGGVALVAGLWIATLSTTGTVSWILGSVLVLLGVGGLGRGIRSGIDYA